MDEEDIFYEEKQDGEILMAETVWDNIYREYLAGGLAWASLRDDIHPSFISFIQESNFPTQYALDIGCGTGKYLKYLQLNGFQTVGLDSSETAITMSRDILANQGELILADMYEYHYPQNTFGLVLSHATLHHGKKKSVARLVEKIYDALMIKGKVFISIPSDECKTNWAMMAECETLEDGTCIPLIGPEKGLAHSFFSKEDVDKVFSRYSNLEITLDEWGRWIITGEK